MRGKRRLGVAEDGGSARWAGFAGLARTVVEALVDEGGRRDEDIESSKAMVANRLADMRHVLGGECENAVSTEQGVADLREHLSNAEKAVVRHGGATSELRERLATARQYLSYDAVTRASRPDTEWEALRSVLACDVPAPEWICATGDAAAEKEARLQLEKAVTISWQDILQAATNLRSIWREASAAEVARRARLEEGRGIMRVLLRAWREVGDGVRANATKWDGRWEASVQSGHGCALARRLSFDTNGSMWTTEYGWQLRMLLAWQRLVRAGKVAQARRGSSVWRDAEAKRLSAMARTAWEGAMPSKRGRVEGFAWRDETTVAREQNVTSGAAAVLVRRQHHQQASPITANRGRGRRVMEIEEETHAVGGRSYSGGDRALTLTEAALRRLEGGVGAGGDRTAGTDGVG